jgi:branched-chain amino acid transport system substrate-binding protein
MDVTRRFNMGRCICVRAFGLLAFGLITGFVGARLAGAQTPSLKIAVAAPLTGPSNYYGEPVSDAVKLAVAEANAEGKSPRIEVSFYDDHSSDEGAREIADDIGASDALVVVGPALTTSAIASGLNYAEAGIASIVPTAHGDAVTDNETTFRTVVSTSEMGEALANYLHHILDGKRAIIIFRDNGYGRPVDAGFRRAAERLGIAVESHGYTNRADLEEIARVAAIDPDRPAIVLGMIADDAVVAMTAIRRANSNAYVLGTDAIALDSFAGQFADRSEYRDNHGYFTDGIYTVSPMLLDSANAETLAFASRFRTRYGRDPGWPEGQAYEATRLAIAAVREAFASQATDLQSRRRAVREFLVALDGPANAMPGLTGPLWFTSERGRVQSVRVGRFHGELIESAPLQLVAVPNPDRTEIAAGSIVDLGAGRFARRQQVVYSGIYLNEVSRIDIAQSRFTADLYLWVRYARGAGAGSADPANIDFPDLVRGSSDGKVLAARGDLDDGTTYRLWRMRGDFKNDFDLHRYPADGQTLAVRFFNAGAASDRIVYVQDRRSSSLPSPQTTRVVAAGGAAHASEAAATPRERDSAAADGEFGSMVAPDAFRNLTQWEAWGAQARRDNLVTASALGDPRLVGVERVRELSGFQLSVDLQRKFVATLAKTLLPLGLMSLIMFASLYFPNALVKEKVTVAITGALSGAVLLTSINSQLGSIGYIIAVEYGFYVFFGLCLLCIVSVLGAERLRASSHQAAAVVVERSGRYLFVVIFVATAMLAWLVYGRG